MNRLLCRWIEYYLALCDDDSERGLPAWVRRHLEACVHCQANLQTYRRAREAVRQYARLLPDSPPMGWRPLQVSGAAKRHVFPLQLVLAPIAAVAVVMLGFVVWQRISIPVDEPTPPTQIAQGTTVQQPEKSTPVKKPAAPAVTSPTRGNNSKPIEPASPAPTKPAPEPRRQTPPAYHPPKRIVIAAQPKGEAAPVTDTEPATESTGELVVPVQPVVVEAHPVSSATVPEGYVIEAAYPATAGAVE